MIVLASIKLQLKMKFKTMEEKEKFTKKVARNN